jgi:hypothetical protein
VKNYLRMSGLGFALAFSMSAQAQTAAPAAAPAPPPAWKQGMPESMANSTLAPLAGKLVATKAADVYSWWPRHRRRRER